MRIIAVDDEKLALEGLMTEIALAAPEAEINGFRGGRAALEYCAGLKETSETVDVAFLDIEMRGMSGMTLGEKLLALYPGLNLIYTTGYSEYAVQAIDMRCSGYVLKPVTADKIRHELEHLRNPVSEHTEKRLYARTFGKFEVYADGRPLKFKYQKTKELLAYLIDRRGELVSIADIMSALWEDDSPDSTHVSYLKNIRTDLVKTLGESGCTECIARTRGEIGVITSAIDCDYYDYLANQGVEGSDRLFKGEYMSQYSWGEYTLASLYGRQEIWD
ncbi:MAG: response regulator [Lachnospiraceae bacterium]|nr:response regulator [Lachnospiraceae bacterium]